MQPHGGSSGLSESFIAHLIMRPSDTAKNERGEECGRLRFIARSGNLVHRSKVRRANVPVIEALSLCRVQLVETWKSHQS